MMCLHDPFLPDLPDQPAETPGYFESNKSIAQFFAALNPLVIADR